MLKTIVRHNDIANFMHFFVVKVAIVTIKPLPSGGPMYSPRIYNLSNRTKRKHKNNTILTLKYLAYF